MEGEFSCSRSVPSFPNNVAMRPAKQVQLDPLYVIFEEHLYNFQDSDSDRRVFIGNIVKDYLTYLRKMNVVIPKSLEASIIEELGIQVNTMLVKKIYGCLTIDEYKKTMSTTVKRKARSRYTRLSRQGRKQVQAKASTG